MSAIAGVVRLNGQPVTRNEVAAMLDALAHRGADAHIWNAGSVGLGVRGRGTLADAGGSAQTAQDEAAGVVLVADARVDNRLELMARLGLDTRVPRQDAELLLHAYLRWGSECADKVVGDFAFATWDARTGRAFCARDGMGVRPFYYVHSENFFAFASEAKALFALGEVPDTLDTGQVVSFITVDTRDRTRTLYSAIRRLPAGHSMDVRASGAALSEHWRPHDAPDVRFGADQQYADAFRELLIEAVRTRLPAQGPVAATLSGGLDSSTIVCIARGLLADRPAELHTLSLIFPGLSADDLKAIDERSYIQAVLEAGPVQSQYLHGDESSPLQDVDRLLGHVDEPYFAPNLYLHWIMYGAAERLGAEVFLDGFDGDSAVGHGFGRLSSLLRSGNWSAFESEVRSLALNLERPAERVLEHYGMPHLRGLAEGWHWRQWYQTAAQFASRFQSSPRALVLQHGARAAVPLWLRRVRQRPDLEFTLLRPALARVRRRTQPPLEAGAASERQSHVEGVNQPAYQLTLELANKAAAARGLEPRYPFFDRRIIEFCVGLPEEQKFAGGWPRLHLRRALEGILPPRIQWRILKANLSPSFHRRLRLADRSVLEAADYRVLEPWVDVRKLERVRRTYLERSPSGWDEPESSLLFRLTVLSRWLTMRSQPRASSAQEKPGVTRAA